MKVFRSLLLAVAFVASTGSTALAQDFDKGVAAYNSGDYVTALQEWRPLAEQGYADAQYNLGLMYDNGLGVPQDDKEAVKWYRKAADQGVAAAQNNLGQMYRLGEGVLQNNTKGHMWFNIAAANGLEDAGKWRDKIAEKMTSAAIEKAQSMASTCMESGYKDCGY